MSTQFKTEKTPTIGNSFEILHYTQTVTQVLYWFRRMFFQQGTSIISQNTVGIKECCSLQPYYMLGPSGMFSFVLCLLDNHCLIFGQAHASHHMTPDPKKVQGQSQG